MNKYYSVVVVFSFEHATISLYNIESAPLLVREIVSYLCFAYSTGRSLGYYATQNVSLIDK